MQCPLVFLLVLSEEDGLVLEPGDSTKECAGVLLQNKDISKDLPNIENILEDHPQKLSIDRRANTAITRQITRHIEELQKAPEITDELATNPRIAMCRRLRELEMGSLEAIRAELRKQASALRPGLKSRETGEIPTLAHE